MCLHVLCEYGPVQDIGAKRSAYVETPHLSYNPAEELHAFEIWNTTRHVPEKLLHSTKSGYVHKFLLKEI